MAGKNDKDGARLLKRFGPYLKKRRKRQKLTLRELATLVGTAHSNVYQYEREGKNPRLTELLAIAEAFREPLDKFLRPLLPGRKKARKRGSYDPNFGDSNATPPGNEPHGGEVLQASAGSPAVRGDPLVGV